MQIVLGVDFDADCGKTFKHNFPEARFLQCDIRTLQPDELLPLIEPHRNDPILFAGCAPCQPFSRKNRNHGQADTRTDLLGEFGRLIAACLPDYVLVENVPGIQNILLDKPGPLPGFIELLDRLGYQVDTRVVKSQDYGVPQRRARFVLLASLNNKIDIPDPTHGPKSLNGTLHVTAWEMIQGLPAIKAGETHPTIKNHISAGLSQKNLERLTATPEGGDRRNWREPHLEHLILECHKKIDADKDKRGHMDVYGRMRKYQPANTLTTRCISISNGRFAHPDQNRGLSVREAACLQTFPMDFEFIGGLNSTARQVGNAVPVELARVFGLTIAAHAEVNPRNRND
jgi:DNA (cytosine-5)-methyltransferase 1